MVESVENCKVQEMEKAFSSFFKSANVVIAITCFMCLLLSYTIAGFRAFPFSLLDILLLQDNKSSVRIASILAEIEAPLPKCK
jgi:hypothetical protein